MPRTTRRTRQSPTLQQLRRVLSNQVRMWDRALDDLEPWRQEGSLRWHGARLDGATLVESGQVQRPGAVDG